MEDSILSGKSAAEKVLAKLGQNANRGTNAG
jgi:hypothetical protein